jgi:hypothetical protein
MIGTDVRRPAGRATQSKWFEWATRIGFVARGVVYAVIGLLAIQVSLHSGGKVTDQKGALSTIAHQPFGHGLLVAAAIGFGAYALWRLVQASRGRGPEGGGDASTTGRLAALGSAVAYAGMCVLSISVLTGSSSSSGTSPHHSTAGVLGWSGGRYIVGAAGVLLLGVGLYQGYKGLSRKFMQDEKTDRMSPTVRRWFERIGVLGHLARMVVFGLVGIFAIEAARSFNAKKAVGLDGALHRLAGHSYGTVLLGVVAAGLFAFGVFSILESRYRRI